jgi:hypothetical protein
LAPAFFKWLLDEESSMGLEDLERLDPTIYRSLRAMAQSSADEFEDMEIVI